MNPFRERREKKIDQQVKKVALDAYDRVLYNRAESLPGPVNQPVGEVPHGTSPTEFADQIGQRAVALCNSGGSEETHGRVYYSLEDVAERGLLTLYQADTALEESRGGQYVPGCQRDINRCYD